MIKLLPFIQGFGISGGLIMAIGSQNAYVLSQGLKRQRVLLTALTCAVLDAGLICMGVLGFGGLLSLHPDIIHYIRWFGVAFLIAFGAKSFYSAFFAADSSLEPENAKTASLKATLLILVALSVLNPHAYLDTVVLLGSIAAQHPYFERLPFALGAICMSFVWFFGLAYGARILTPLFKKPVAWRILDTIVGCTMWGIALSLLL